MSNTAPTVVDKIEALSERLQRARQLIESEAVSQLLGLEDHFTVQSSAEDGSYLVNGTCSCPDAKYRSKLTNGVCKHKLAVILYQESRSQPIKIEAELRCFLSQQRGQRIVAIGYAAIEGKATDRGQDSG